MENAVEGSGVAAARDSLARADRALSAGDLESVLKVTEEALDSLADSSPKERSALLQRRAHVFVLRRDPVQARAAIESALAADSDVPWSHYCHGTVLETLGEYELALSAFERATLQDERHLKAWQWRGHVAALLGRHERAVADYTRAIDLTRAADASALTAWGGESEVILAECHAGRARSFAALGRHDEARRDREWAQESD